MRETVSPVYRSAQYSSVPVSSSPDSASVSTRSTCAPVLSSCAAHRGATRASQTLCKHLASDREHVTALRACATLSQEMSGCRTLLLSTAGQALVYCMAVRPPTFMASAAAPSRLGRRKKAASCSTHMFWNTGLYAALRATRASWTTTANGTSAFATASRTSVRTRASSSRMLGAPVRGKPRA